DPAVSYAIYGTLHEAGEADYYTVTMQKGDPLYFMASTPDQGSFAPWLVIAGPGLPPQGTVPEGIEVPEGDTAVVVTGVRPLNAEYEPFSPMAIFPTALYEGTAPADGTYVIAVYTPDAVGPYTLASGKLESFTATEWIMIPVTMIGVRFWQEQPFWLIFGPYLVVLIAGLALILRWPGHQRMNTASWIGIVAGLLYLGSGAATLLQTIIALQVATADSAVLITLIIAAIQIGAGAAAVYISLNSSDPSSMKFRIQMVIIGIVGLVAWAGLVIGPVLAFAAALIPARKG
ncbi:MAG: hypothetical protein LUQ69_04830, partial [Methanoregulaceae archaeon]|nr:hypothetical protein [Methanoregulaceae archaeon]